VKSALLSQSTWTTSPLELWASLLIFRDTPLSLGLASAPLTIARSHPTTDSTTCALLCLRIPGRQREHRTAGRLVSAQRSLPLKGRSQRANFGLHRVNPISRKAFEACRRFPGPEIRCSSSEIMNAWWMEPSKLIYLGRRMQRPCCYRSVPPVRLQPLPRPPRTYGRGEYALVDRLCALFWSPLTLVNSISNLSLA
jgi:hypothetical protein